MTYIGVYELPTPDCNAKRKLLYFLLISVLFCSWLFLYVKWEQEILLNPGLSYLQSEALEPKYSSHLKDEFVINQIGCRIPSMTVLGPSVSNYITSAKPLICQLRISSAVNLKRDKVNGITKSWLPALINDNGNSLSIDPSVLIYYGNETINCSYRSFNRYDSASKKNLKDIDNSVKYSNIVTPLNNSKSMIIDTESSEFVEVQCHKQENTSTRIFKKPFYRDYFAFVPQKKHVEERCEEFDQRANTERMSVLVLGLDALSRLNFHRQLPQSTKYLKENMDAIEMLGFNKVGDNTFPNLIPTLTGLSVEELKRECWPNNGVFDDCPMIWKMFRDNGFRTVFAEDAPSIGLFNYLKKGFRNQPTDYYLRPFYTEAEMQIGYQKPLNCNLCLGSRISLSVLLGYALKHFLLWKNKKFFGFFWSTSFTHDFFNLPAEGDSLVLHFLKTFKESNSSESTILVIMSDHGLRWGSFRETYQGHLEERLPTLMFVLPESFKLKYWKAFQNLVNNAKMLTTHYDLQKTLLDLTNLTKLVNDVIGSEEQTNERGRSLFVPISGTRSCAEAGIPKNYCTCHDDVQILQVNDRQVVVAAQVLIEHINGLLESNEQCAKLKIHSIEHASVETSTMGGKSDLQGMVSDFMISVSATPGNGMFEGTIRFDHDFKRYQVTGQISHINTYSSQSFCVDDYILKLYCYCIH